MTRQLLHVPALAVLLWFLGGAPPALAGEQLKAQIIQVSPKARSNAPVAAEVEFNWEGAGIVEGRLDVRARDGGDLLGSCLTSDFALAKGMQRYAITLPPAVASYSGSTMTIRMDFITADGSKPLRLGTQILYAPSFDERSFVICVPDASGVTSPGRLKLASSLRIENFMPAEPQGTGSRGAVITSIAHVPVDSLPVSPLGYLSYDIVLLDGMAFSAMKETQLHALAAWVKAGGSLCVLPGGNLLDRHTAFLNSLCRPASDDFVAGNTGALLTPLQNARRTRPGLGRFVILPGDIDLESYAAGREWILSAVFLWKMRISARQSVLSSGKWLAPVENQEDYYYYGQRYAPRPFQNGTQLVEHLLPKSVRIMPGWVVFLILFLFVLAIGPLDYFVLGMLKMRRFTWVLFPVLCVGFAVFTMLLSEHYMGTTDSRSWVTVVDVGEDGSPLRSSRFEVIFTAGHRRMEFDFANELFIPLSRDAYRGYSYRGAYESGSVGAPLYSGRFPGRYSVLQNFNQWTPQVNRILSLEPSGLPSSIDWNSITVADMAGSPAAEPLLSKLFAGNSSARADVIVFNQAGNRNLLRNLHFPPGVLANMCVAESKAFFKVVSQISPDGSATFEDLCILDREDPAQWLLVVVEAVGNNFIVWRRLYNQAAGAVPGRED